MRGNKKAIRSDSREDGYSGVQIGRVVERRISSKRKKILGIDAGGRLGCDVGNARKLIAELQAEPMKAGLSRAGIRESQASRGTDVIARGRSPFGVVNFFVGYSKHTTSHPSGREIMRSLLRAFGLHPQAVEIISCGQDHNLAKVGVEGSNPFARSKFSQGKSTLKRARRKAGRTLRYGTIRESTRNNAGLLGNSRADFSSPFSSCSAMGQ